MTTDTFKTLYEFDCEPHFEHMDKSFGDIRYLSWHKAWALLRTLYPNSTYSIREFGPENLPYQKTELGFLVEVSVYIEGRIETEKYAVTDNNFKAVSMPDISQITDAHQRALVKAIARHGLGLKAWESKKQKPRLKSLESVTGIETAKVQNPGSYICKVKKFEGKTLSSLKDYEILNYIDWLKANTELKWPEQKEFISYGQAYLDGLTKKTNEEPPVFEPDIQWDTRHK